MVIDILIAALIFLFAFIGMKRGIAKSLLNIAGLIVTAISAYYVSSFLSQLIYDSFIKQSVITNIQHIIQQNGFDYAVSNSLNALPGWINGIIAFLSSIFGVSFSQFQSQLTVPKNFTVSTSQVIESVLQPIVTSILGIILISVLFIVFFILIKKLVKLASRPFEFPVVKQINHFLGFILGMAEGALIVFVTVNIFFTAAKFSNPELINNPVFNGVVFNFFCIFR